MDWALRAFLPISSEVKDKAGEDGFRYRDLGRRELKGLGTYPLYEVVWREEVARLATKDDDLELVLTGDNRLVVKVSKEIQGKLAQAREKLRAEAEKRGGLAAIIRGVEQQLSGTFESVLSSLAGMALDYGLENLEIVVDKNELVLRPKGGREIRLGAKDVDIRRAMEFAARLKERKSGRRLEEIATARSAGLAMTPSGTTRPGVLSTLCPRLLRQPFLSPVQRGPTL